MKKFDLRHFVKVQLTEVGLAIHKQEYESRLYKSGEWNPPIIDDEGWTGMPLLHLMKLFGGRLDENPFKPTALISELSLTDCEGNETSVLKARIAELEQQLADSKANQAPNNFWFKMYFMQILKFKSLSGDDIANLKIKRQPPAPDITYRFIGEV